MSCCLRSFPSPRPRSRDLRLPSFPTISPPFLSLVQPSLFPPSSLSDTFSTPTPTTSSGNQRFPLLRRDPPTSPIPSHHLLNPFLPFNSLPSSPPSTSTPLPTPHPKHHHHRPSTSRHSTRDRTPRPPLLNLRINLLLNPFSFPCSRPHPTNSSNLPPPFLLQPTNSSRRGFVFFLVGSRRFLNWDFPSRSTYNTQQRETLDLVEKESKSHQHQHRSFLFLPTTTTPTNNRTRTHPPSKNSSRSSRWSSRRTPPTSTTNGTQEDRRGRSGGGDCLEDEGAGNWGWEGWGGGGSAG